MHIQYDETKDLIMYVREQHPLEKRFWLAMRELRFDRTARRNKHQEMEIDYLTREIMEYGFTFFPEMYVEDKIERLEGLVRKRQKQKEKNND